MDDSWEGRSEVFLGLHAMRCGVNGLEDAWMVIIID